MYELGVVAFALLIVLEFLAAGSKDCIQGAKANSVNLQIQDRTTSLYSSRLIKHLLINC